MRELDGAASARMTKAMDIGPWQVVLSWCADSSRGPMELTIRGRTDADRSQLAEGITSTMLRSIPLGQLTHDVLDELREALPGADLVPGAEEPAAAVGERIRDMFSQDPTPGRKGRPDEFFALTAALYVWNIANHHTNPVQRIAESCGSTWRVAANWVHLARRKGMLTEGRERFPDGELTSKALDILARRGNAEPPGS